MKKWTLGLMSGTSMDGIDIAVLQTDGIKIFEQGPTLFVPYNEDFKKDLNSILGAKNKTTTIQLIEEHLTHLHYKSIVTFLNQYAISPADIDLIGFHGHTILHQSPKKHPKGRTWQIGNGYMLANLLEIPVVTEFRDNDIKNGGEGAPLVPIFHQALCQNLPKPLAILNIGGIANITYIDDKNLIAFDTGPGNALLDQWMYHHTKEFYDKNGEKTLQGKGHKDWITKWMNHPFFALTPPKSLDRLDFQELPLGLSLEDGLATLAAFTTQCVIEGLKHLPQKPLTLYIAGGGRHNQGLMNNLRLIDPSFRVDPIDVLGFSSDFLEAQAFAYLAKRSIQNLPLTFPTTTGVKEPLTGGILYYPKNAPSQDKKTPV
ncbi:MAG: anhydro-N-acetylmuramic acid kinase [Alphaproteobacteria bacterium]|nr:anhydro-N-acetylmuramic acid kinase [Alphaproteobacteria bacterium]